MISRLVTALASQSDLPISAARSGQTVLAFESVTGEMMLRSRVVQALEVAIGATGRRRADAQLGDVAGEAAVRRPLA